MYKEDEITELKRELTKDIKKEIVAFANTKGGTIYVGIDDNGKVVGVKNSKKDIEDITNMINRGIKSDLTLFTNVYAKAIDGKEVIVIEVQSAPDKPYYLSEKGLKSSGVFIRHGSSSIPASNEAIRMLFQQNTNINFEIEESKKQDLHFDYLINSFKNHGIKLNKANMKTLNIINTSNKYTNLGLLLSEENPFTIKCAIFDGTNNMSFRDRKEFTGSVLNQVDEVFKYLDLFNRIKGTIKGLVRVDQKDYPDYAVRESLLNAVIHRNYNYNGSIIVSMYDDRIEIVSLGGLVNGLSIDEIYDGVSQLRNPNLVNIFHRLEYIESFGTGIARILESYEQYDKKPIFKDTQNTFRVILSNTNYEETIEENVVVKDNLSQEDKIIQFIKEHIVITRKEAEELLGLSKTRTYEILNKLVTCGVVQKNGESHATFYTLK